MEKNNKLACRKCSKIIKSRLHIKCCHCNKHYHVDCTHISEKRFHLMTKENKEQWKCMFCCQKKSVDPECTPVQPKITSKIKNLPSDKLTLKITDSKADNITLRKKQIISQNPLLNVSSDISSLDCSMDNTCRSLPDLSEVNHNEIEQLKEELESVKRELQSAHFEIENLMLENSSLKKITTEQQKKLAHLKDICYGSPEVKNMSQRKKHKNRSIESPKCSTNVKKSVIKQKEIQSTNLFASPCSMSQLIDSDKKENEQNTCTPQADITHKNKVCIVTSNKRLRILQNLNRISTYNDFEILHYISDKVGIDILLKDIETKLISYTKRDYCVVMIGETDFLHSQDLKFLVNYLRQKLEKITNTNIIITTPTYICGKPLYNYRVETFNNILNYDILSWDNQMVNLIDSNKDLSFDMFSLTTGKILNHGVQNILGRIANLLVTQRFQNCTNQTSVESPNNQDCFRH